MLNRFRDLVKRLELPEEQSQQGETVYRIIDNNHDTLEVTPAQYAIWRTQNDVTRRAVVGQDSVANVMVRTTFSIMPENRSYKPFGTSAYELPLYDPLLEFSRRYDTWREAERGHQETLQLVAQRTPVEDAAVQETSAEEAGSVAVIALIGSGLPDLFHAEPSGGGGVRLRTPWLIAGGNPVELLIAEEGGGYALSDTRPSPSGEAGRQAVPGLFDLLGVSILDGRLAARAEDTAHLPSAVVALSQAIACSSFATASG